LAGSRAATATTTGGSGSEHPMTLFLLLLSTTQLRGGQVVEIVLQSVVELRTELVLIQEPREGKDGTASHPGFRNIMKEMKVWIAVSNEARCRIDPVDVGGGEGYVQVVDITVSQQKIRVVSMYDQEMTGSNRKPAEEINWSRLIRGRCIAAGDMMRTARCGMRGQARRRTMPGFWKAYIVEDFECRIWNLEEETRWGINANNHSIIDLTLTTIGVELNWFTAALLWP